MTVLFLALLLVWIGVGVIFRTIGLAVRLAVMVALASAIWTLAGAGALPS